MGCTWSGLSALYDAVNCTSDLWLNDRRFRIVRQLGEGGYAFVYLVKEQAGGRPSKPPKDPSHVAEDGCYALKKVLVQTDEQLELVKQEIRSSALFDHPNLLPLIDHSIIAVKGTEAGTWVQEAYLLFPVFVEGTLFDELSKMHERKEFFPTITVLHIFRQLCAGLQCMHNFEPPYAHNDVKPGNVLLTSRKDKPPLAVLMDFGSTAPAIRRIRSRTEALQLQEWAAQHSSAPYRAPELWDCPSHADLEQRTDIWALGCTLFALMYGVSPFEYSLGEAGGSLQLAAMSGQIKWPPPARPPYPETLHAFVIWMLNAQADLRPGIDDVILHLDRMLGQFPSIPFDVQVEVEH
eukprot:TRINITY_DN19121_c0_g1_i1.p1 TRINITY_DN19121_c0_g1~~TRINITY_DN19121_c0_g1_i1.p1  ORF type:complete len:399 (+),score=60.11 TRINITY_DN19121_c0_g1_i1:150-1199(+)